MEIVSLRGAEGLTASATKRGRLSVKVGMALFMQNPKATWSDREVYCNGLALGDLAEPLGFDSLWSVEHHFSEYTMIPDVLQMLTYFAGRTERILLGSQVVVLPWHDPVRVAEQIAMLDHFADGRIIIGMGRGAASLEYAGMRVPMESSRERFVEAAQIVIKGLTEERFSHDGEIFQVPEISIRPRPFSHPEHRLYGAAVSPASAEGMAKLGLGVMTAVPLFGWDVLVHDLEHYREIQRGMGIEPVAPITQLFVYCAETEQKAKQGARQHMDEYWATADAHYGFTDGHLKHVKGYEHYGEMAEQAAQVTPAEGLEGFINVNVVGDPQQCLEQILAVREMVGFDHFIGVFNYGCMPPQVAEHNTRLFASEVMPHLQALPDLQAAPSVNAAAS